MKKVQASEKDVISVCILRHSMTLSCRNCLYTGEECKRLINKHSVEKPKDVNDTIQKSH